MMKRKLVHALAFLLTAVLLAGSVTPIRAAEAEEKLVTVSPEARTLLSEAQARGTAESLLIDPAHIYPGMTEAYQNGYTPEITDGKARMIVPFVWCGETPIDSNQITVTLEFPGSSGQVFLGANYRKTISEQSVAVGAEFCKVYLLDVPVEIKEGSAAGTYPITVKSVYRVEHLEKKQDFTIYITLRENTAPSEPTNPSEAPSSGVTPTEKDDPSADPSANPSGEAPGSTNPPGTDPGSASSGEPTDPVDPGDSDPTQSTDDLYGDVSGDGKDSGVGSSGGSDSVGSYSGGGDSAETKPDAAPRLLVESCEISPGEYRAGDAVEVLLTISNTSSKKSLRNIHMTYASSTGEISPMDMTPDFYLAKLGKSESFEEVLRLRIADGAASTSQPITLTMDFEDTDGNTYASAETIYLTLTRDMDFRVDTPVVPLTMEAMSSQEITLNLFNVGTAKVKNVICQVEMEGIVPKGSTYVGDVEPNATGQAVIGIVVGDLTYQNPEREDKYGKTTGTITVIYEDEQGNSYEQTVFLSSEIVKPEGVADETEPVKYESQWWVSIVTGLIIFQALVMLVFWQRKKHRFS